ncbi:glycerophosphodiester phosphodiesterase [Halobacterium jilantaiense]|uniref:Glycerophosphoryl diester phosphodiesterase n=1 Tax=Halobacterium jilantaiense TaxID=355548 RepID=A0A1I0QH40_9EURY|nr:glycerophosphodiester phosphodiesterase [Halobacterium jilantaiense]SEW26457.1 glycerophosphoryl diester phosphodiesterase [Halobacterium jilantaiense]
MRELAHRGFAGVAPENTLAAVEAAVGGSADGVEVDVQPASDGTPVVFHDHRLDDSSDSRGITDGAGFVWDASPDALREADVLGSGEGVPTLDAVAETVPADTVLHVELKTPGVEATIGRSGPDESRWRPFVERVASVLDAADAPVVFSSFFDGALAAAREAAPGIPRAALCLDADRGLDRAREFDCEALHPPVDAVDAALVERAHGRGWAVNAWTVETWREALVCRDAGVDGVITDYPGVTDFADGEKSR